MIKNICVYIIFLVVSGLSAYYLNNRLGYTPFLFLIFLGVLDFVLAFSAKRFLKLDEEKDVSEVTLGDTSLTTFSFKNTSRIFSVFFKVNFQFCGENLEKPVYKSRPVIISPHEAIGVYFSLTPPHIGMFNVTVKKIRVFGLLGVFSFREKVAVSKTVMVLPKLGAGLLDGAAQKSGTASEAQDKSSEGSLLENPDYYSGVREYEPGDPMHSIHWKLTAHTGNYMTRLFEGDGLQNEVIAVDLRKAPCGLSKRLFVNDKLLTAVMSSAYLCALNDSRMRAVFCDGGESAFFLVSSLSDVPVLIERLLSARQPILPISKIIPQGETVGAAFTAVADMDLALLFNDKKKAGGDPQIIFATAGDDTIKTDAEFFSFLKKHDIDYKLAPDYSESANDK